MTRPISHSLLLGIIVALVCPNSARTQPVRPPAKAVGGKAVEASANAVIGKVAIQAKLDSIVIPELNVLEGFSLNEAVDLLTKLAARADPDAARINFLFAAPKLTAVSASVEFVPHIDPNTGLPIPGRLVPGTVPSVVDPKTGRPLVKTLEPILWGPSEAKISGVVHPLRGITLGQALKIIVRTADIPTKFTVEDYGVVIEADVAQSNVPELEKLQKRLDRLEMENEIIRKLLAERLSLPVRKP